jgi:integrase
MKIQSNLSGLIEGILRIIWIQKRANIELLERIKKLDFDCISIDQWNLLICRNKQNPHRCDHIVILDDRTSVCLMNAVTLKRKATGWLDTRFFTKSLLKIMESASLENYSTPNKLIEFVRSTRIEKNRFTLPLSLAALYSGETSHQEMGLSSLVPLLSTGWQLKTTVVDIKSSINNSRRLSHSGEVAIETSSESFKFESDRAKLRKSLSSLKSNQRAHLEKCICNFTAKTESFSVFAQWLSYRLAKLPKHGSNDNVKIQSLLAIFDKGIAPLSYLVGYVDPVTTPSEGIEEFLLDYFSLDGKASNTFHNEVNRINNFFSFASSKHSWPQITLSNNFKSINSDKIISAKEYLIMWALIEKQPIRIRRYLRAILCLGFKFGLRIGEIFNLRRQDIVLAEDCPIVLIRSRRGATVKYSSSIRNAIASSSLEPSEREVLVSLISSNTGAHGTRLIDSGIFEELYKICNLIIKEVAGRGSIHTLRHSCAYFWISAAFHASLKESDDAEVLSKISEGQRRHYSLFAIGALMGHSSFSKVTLCNYFHSLALVSLPKQTQALFLPVDTVPISFEESNENAINADKKSMAEALAHITLGAMCRNEERINYWIDAFTPLQRRKILNRIAELNGNKNQAGFLRSERLVNLKKNNTAEQFCVDFAVKYHEIVFKASKITNPIVYLSTRSTLVINRYNEDELMHFFQEFTAQSRNDMIGAVRLIESKPDSELLKSKFKALFTLPLKPPRSTNDSAKAKSPKSNNSPRGGYGQFFHPPESDKHEIRIESQQCRKLLFLFHFVDFINAINLDLE